MHTPHVQLSSRLWPLLGAIPLLVQILWPSRAWVVLLIILGGGWACAYFWARSLVRSLHIKREMRFGWAQVGDRLEERFTLTNSGWAPALWIELKDKSTLPDYRVSRVTSIGSHTQLQWKVERTCTRRGLYTLGPAVLRTTDPLGIYSVELPVPDATILMVMPPVVSLPNIQVAPGGRVGEGRRPRRQALETTVSVETVRPYVPGEAQKAVHWPTTARRGELFVRQFEHTPSSDWWIFLDLESGAQVGHGFDSTEEHGVILAASLADMGLRQGHAVGLAVNSKQPVWLPPRHSAGQRMDILRALAVVESGEHSLEKLLLSQKFGLRNKGSLILVTPNVAGDWLKPLTQMQRAGVTPTVILLDPVSFGGQDSPDRLLQILNRNSIDTTVVTRDLLDRPEARPGTQGLWEWRILRHGKAIPVRRPSDLRWKKLG
jgi:uncharacterized protein (DUF58 family)